MQSDSDSSAQYDSSSTGAFRVFIDILLLYLFRFMVLFGNLSLTELCVGAIFLMFSSVNGVNLPRPFCHYVNCLNSPNTILVNVDFDFVTDDLPLNFNSPAEATAQDPILAKVYDYTYQG